MTRRARIGTAAATPPQRGRRAGPVRPDDNGSSVDSKEVD
jgi:hypothetical protein